MDSLHASAIRDQPVAIVDLQSNEELCSVKAGPKTRIEDVKRGVENLLGCPPIQQRIYNGDHLLKDQDQVGVSVFRTEQPYLHLQILTDKEAHFEERKTKAIKQMTSHQTDLAHLEEDLRADRDIVMCAIHRVNPAQLQHAADWVRADVNLMLEAIGVSTTCKYYVAEELWNDVDFVRGVMAVDGMFMAEPKIPEYVKNDIGVAMEAVMQNGYSLEHCTTEIKNHREVVIAAVNGKGCSLKFASEELRSDYYIVLDAVRENKTALFYAMGGMREDETIREAAGAPPTKKNQLQSAKVKEKFRQLDTNHDGYLSFEELEALLRRGDNGMTEPEVRLLYDQLDTHQDGKVDFHEFCDFIYGF